MVKILEKAMHIAMVEEAKMAAAIETASEAVNNKSKTSPKGLDRRCTQQSINYTIIAGLFPGMFRILGFVNPGFDALHRHN